MSKAIGFIYDKRGLMCIGKVYPGNLYKIFGWYLNELFETYGEFPMNDLITVGDSGLTPGVYEVHMI